MNSIKNRGYIGSLPSASSRQRMPRGSSLFNLGTLVAYLGILPTAGRRQRGSALCRLPAVSKEAKVFADCRQSAKRLRSLPTASRRQKRPRGSFPVTPIWPLCRLPADGKDLSLFAVCRLTANHAVNP